jgi:homoserine kinase
VSGRPIEVEVPATSANLGPGFDAFGVALSVGLRATVVARQERRIIPSGEGADEVSTGDDNLVWRALVAYSEWSGETYIPDVSVAVHSDIPLERGMGSSSAAAVAGVTLGRFLLGGGGTNQSLIELATEFDGHPDNVAPAILGGLVVCVDGVAHRLDPTPLLRPVICVPRTRQSTREARGILPASLPLAAAAANGARAAVVLAGLAGAMPWDPRAMVDVLHEPVRLHAMAPSGHLVAELRARGIGACLSGAGPSVLAVVGAGDEQAVDAVRAAAGDLWTVRPLEWQLEGAGAKRFLPGPLA